MKNRASWSGFQDITQEDAVVSCSMGPIYDRTKERLVAADASVMELRRILLDSLQRCEAGLPPLGLEFEDLTHMRGVDRDLAIGEPWQGLTVDHARHYPMDGG